MTNGKVLLRIEVLHARAGGQLVFEDLLERIKPMDKASEAIHALKPVTFRYKKELDPEGIPQFGLVAEQVVKVNPNLVARDEQENRTPSATKR